MRDIDEYQGLAKRTAPTQYKTPTQQQMALLQASLGLAKEAGEVADLVYKHVFYGKPLNPGDLDEESGDLEWYVALLHNAIGFVMSITLENNIQKLRKRYPQGFSEADALARADKTADGTDVVRREYATFKCENCGAVGKARVLWTELCVDCHNARAAAKKGI